MGQDRAKAATLNGKGKGNEGSSSQSESSSAVGGMISTPQRLSISFAKAHLWKQWNKLKEHSTVYMDEEELENHRIALRLIEKDHNFAPSK
jgi:hypothetical protein